MDGRVSVSDAPVRMAAFWTPDIEVRRTDDGTIYVDQRDPLPPYPDRITEPLLEWAERVPDRTLYADRSPDGNWRRLSFADAVAGMKALGQYLLDAGLSEKHPLVILSGNSVEHALLALAAIHTGIPYAAVSPAYSLVSKDYARLKDVFAAISPGMVYAADADRFRPAIEAVAPDIPRLFSTGAQAGETTFADALATAATDDVDKAFAAVTPDTVAKFLFTSGSTGTPKAVMNTHRMICSNQAMCLEVFAYFRTEPPVLLDWAPWHHTAGGNKLFFLAIFAGGTLYVDDGNPTPEGVVKTVRNLKEISPNWYFNVPKGFEALIPYLEEDRQLRESLFRDLKMFWYAGAGMAQHTWEALERLAVETVGERIIIGAGLGATETAPAALMCTWPAERAGNVGLPCPGMNLKLVPFEGKLDARVKGPNITPGYWNAPELTAKAFDEEGYYCFGDAVRPVDPEDISAGFYFDGRTAENFKLDTGTWVATGALRTHFIDHFGGAARDVAIAGADQPYLSALVFPDFGALRRIAGTDETDHASLIENNAVRAFFAEKIQSLAEQATGSSTLIRKLVLVDPPPSMDAGELTDKGSINQRAVLRNRADIVDGIYAGTLETIAIAGDVA